jgi:S-formylglutathione hydrolase FrmB
MRRRVGLTVLVVLAAAVPAASAADEPPLPQMGDAHPPLELVSQKQLSPRLTEYWFKSPYVPSPTPVRVLAPAGYDPASERRYPVLYLVHGCCDDWRSWTDKGGAEAESAPYPVFVVMPDASAQNTSDGWYADWFNDGAFGDPRWESYHVGELIPWIDAHLKTIAARRGRAIAGLSMGGFGAMSYASRHPDLFAAAAAFSGAVDLNDPQPSGFAAVSPSIFGSYAEQQVRWRMHNPTDLAANLRGMSLTLRTGDGTPGGPLDTAGPGLAAQDGLEYAVHRQMVDLNARLNAVGLPHVWQDYGPGSHDWPYWRRDLKLTLPTFMSVFDAQRRAPSPFDFTAAEPTFSVFGWTVRMKRSVLEFAQLADADDEGFELIGSGSAVVTTAPSYQRGSVHTVRVTTDRDSTKSVVSTITADGDGRLAIPVDLGPSSTTQDYSGGQPNERRVAFAQISGGEQAPAPVARTTRCAGRSVRLHPRRVAPSHIRSIVVYVGARRVRRLRGRVRVLRVKLADPRAAITLVITTRAGRRVVNTYRTRGC